MIIQLLGCIGAVLLALLVNELQQCLPAVARCVARFWVTLLPTDVRDRVCEEWLSILEETPGNRLKLVRALDFARSVPAIRGLRDSLDGETSLREEVMEALRDDNWGTRFFLLNSSDEIEDLGSGARHALFMLFHEGSSIDEIAAEVPLPKKKVKRILREALAAKQTFFSRMFKEQMLRESGQQRPA